MCVDTPLKDPVLEADTRRLIRLLATMFWKNKAAMRSEFCALVLTLMGKNIDRAFHHIGVGRAGQSLLTAWLHFMLGGLHSYLDTNIYFSDDELRKQGEQ
eukprot:7274199-Karenia_brevis.AAC.1